MSMRPYAFGSGTAVVTGAASGIGEALAHGLVARGSDVVLLDRDAPRLERVAEEIRRGHRGPAIETLVVDLSDRAATLAAAADLIARHPETTLLVNNAGVGLGGRFDQVTLTEFDWLIRINFSAVVDLTHALLPVLTANPGSHLVNVSSIFGIIAPPGQTAYVASKFAVRGFTESLRGELAGRVGVTVVHPGGIATRIATNARLGSGMDPAKAAAGRAAMNRVLRIPPAVAARTILCGIERRTPRVLIGASATLPALASRLAPGSTAALLRLAAARLQ